MPSELLSKLSQAYSSVQSSADILTFYENALSVVGNEDLMKKLKKISDELYETANTIHEVLIKIDFKP